jgi:hypothetical protein
MEYLLTVQDADDRTHDHPAHVTTARQAAEALFRPKAPAPTGRVPATAPPAPDQSGRRPRILRAIEPARSNPEDIVVVALAITTPAAPSVPPSEVPRIKTWLKYGMTTAQVAQVYGVAVTVIERLL